MTQSALIPNRYLTTENIILFSQIQGCRAGGLGILPGGRAQINI